MEDGAHTGQICNNGDDYLVVPGWQQPQVPILAVHALTAAEQDELLRAAGKPAPPARCHATSAPTGLNWPVHPHCAMAHCSVHGVAARRTSASRQQSLG